MSGDADRAWVGFWATLLAGLVTDGWTRAAFSVLALAFALEYVRLRHRL